MFLQRRGNSWIIGIPILLCLCLWVMGCGGGTSPPPPSKKEATPSAPVKKVEAPKVAEVKEPEKKEEPEYSYNPVGKPDPFKPFIQLTPVREIPRTAPLTPLQKYDISQLKLVAIISTPEANVALVEDATGKGYFIKKGTLIGKNEGKVTRILKDRVIIEETYLDVFGKVKTNEVIMLLHKVEEGGES